MSLLLLVLPINLLLLVLLSLLLQLCIDAVPFFQSLAERDAEVSKLRASATALEVELQRKTMDLGALQRQVCFCSGDDTP